MRRRPESRELVVPAARPEVPAVARILFAPVKLVSRRVAPRLSARLFNSLWRLVDSDAPPPRSEEREVSVAKLALALGLEGACTAVVRGVLDQVARREFARLTGRWPGRPAKS